MTWFLDYIYFPLGGSRCSLWKVIRNTFIVFGVSGLWHGANWTFVCWGLYHGCLIVLYKLLHINTKDKDILAAGRWLPNIKDVCRVVVTFLLAVIGWVIFRAENISQAWDFVSRMILTAFDDFHPRLGSLSTAILVVLLMVVEYLQRDKVHALQFSTKGLFQYGTARWMVYLAMTAAIFYYAFNNVGQEFIYFQF
jgi:D-alanyl-lipoteichoic acid acyltransferase DltB (MBOAT superfamily)